MRNSYQSLEELLSSTFQLKSASSSETLVSTKFYSVISEHCNIYSKPQTSHSSNKTMETTTHALRDL